MHRTPTLPLPHIQLNQYHLDLLSGLVLSPLRTTSHIVLEDILLSLHSHAIDNEHNALVQWTYNLFDCRQLLPLTSRLVASMSGLAFNHHSVYTLRLCTLEDTITVHTVASLWPLRGLRFCFSTHLDRVIVITSHLSLSALPHKYKLPRKEEPYLRCSWPMNSPMKPPRRLILSVPRVLDAFCKT